MALADIIIVISAAEGVPLPLAARDRRDHLDGLLYYFNFVQVPALRGDGSGGAHNAIDKLASRALVVPLGRGRRGHRPLSISSFRAQRRHSSCSRLLEVVARHGIATASCSRSDVRERVAGDLAQPEEGDRQRPQRAGRREADPLPRRRPLGALASRMNAIFLHMLFFMVGTAAPGRRGRRLQDLPEEAVATRPLPSSRCHPGFAGLKALGVIGGTAAGSLNWMFDSHKERAHHRVRAGGRLLRPLLPGAQGVASAVPSVAI
jgi:hypothetical protein